MPCFSSPIVLSYPFSFDKPKSLSLGKVISKPETTASPDISAELAEVKRQNNELAAEVAAMKEEDAKAKAAAELSAWPSVSAGSLSPVEKSKK